MKHLRFQVALLVFWLVLFYSIEQILGGMDISFTAYMAVLTLVLTILLSPQISKISLWLTLASSVTLFLIFKGWVGDLSRSAMAAMVVMEVIAVVITTLLAYWLSMAMREFENAVSQITIGHLEKLPAPASTGQGFIYREVRRARNHQRPLALMTIRVSERSLKFAADRMVQEVQMAMMKQYKLSRLSKILCDELEDCAITVQQDDHFIIALPETKPEEVVFIIDRLQKQAAENVGVDLEIGTAALPNDSFTFEGLIDKAMLEMRTGQKSHPPIDLNQMSPEHPMTASK